MSEAEDDNPELDSEPEEGDLEMCLMTEVGEFGIFTSIYRRIQRESPG